MAVLLKQALAPNLVQTLENNPALIHGGPFANIAHGCNSLIATRAALKMADYVVTEAGFGADLGAEKFIDIKCRKSGLRPSAAVVVATIRALKYHGGVDVADVGREDLAALRKGLVNLERHVDNLQDVFGVSCVVAINHRAEDTDAEVDVLEQMGGRKGVKVVLSRHFAEGGKGAARLAEEVVRLCEESAQGSSKRQFAFAYKPEDTLWEKVRQVARRIYRADEVIADSKARAKLQALQDSGYGHFAVCIAKTPYSFSTDPTLRGAPQGHTVAIREVRLAAGAEFIVVLCGDILTMPGLPRNPAALSIDVGDDGTIVGLF
jgi:formate--tetrahydrofolate ligase